jgi:hypothetical protein
MAAPESGPECQPYPEPSEAWDTLFKSALEALVDTLFTYQAIEERLRGRGADEYLAMLLDNRKQLLAEHLKETGKLAIDEFLAHLDHLQAEPGVPLYPPLPESEPMQRLDNLGWHKSFTVASICRDDLQGILTDEEIARLDDSDMDRIADKMGDAYRDTGGYWEALEIMTRSVIDRAGET